VCGLIAHRGFESRLLRQNKKACTCAGFFSSEHSTKGQKALS
jgi:hypothetical protein